VIANNFSNVKLISIPQVIVKTIKEYQDEIIGFVFPIYGYAPPKMVNNFLKKTKFKAEYIFAIETCGGTILSSLYNLQQQALHLGYHIDYVAHLAMVSNYLPKFDINYEIKERLPKKNVKTNLDNIISDIKNFKHNKAEVSNKDRFITFLVKIGSKLVMNGKQAQNYIIDNKCNKCATCIKVCPVYNISFKDNINKEIIFSNKCEYCMACIHLCFENALHLKMRNQQYDD
jgi:ferredoxin